MKVRNEKLIQFAQDALISNDAIWMIKNQSILDAYNGPIAALSVSVAISGLRPALVIYYQEKSSRTRKADKRTILDLIAKMITLDDEYDYRFNNSNEFLRHALEERTDLKCLKKEVIECAIALKQVVRTYNLVSK